MTTRHPIEAGLCECGCGQKTKLANKTLKSRGWVKGQPLRFILNHSRKRDGRNRFLSFEEAREYVHSLGLTSSRQWHDWYKANQPKKIPAGPDRSREYQDKWISWGDWLGTRRVANGKRTFLPFTEAREFARKLGFKTQDEWVRYCESGKKPSNIPVRPAQIYKDEWVSTADWLGSWGFGSWTSKALSGYLQSLAPEIPQMRDVELVALITEAGLDAPLLELVGTPSLAEVITALREQGDRIQGLLRERGEARFRRPRRALQIADGEFAHDELEVNADNIHLPDRLNGKVNPQFIEDLIQQKLTALLVKYINGDHDVRSILKQEGGEFFQEIRRRFESEVRGIMGVNTSCWKLRDKNTGEPTEPNLMQRFIAYKLTTNRTWCNWSGTGAGKTGSAGLASYAIGSHLTLVLCPNSTVGQWADELGVAFHDTRVYTDAGDAEKRKGSFLVLNYDKFQLGRRSDELAEAIVRLQPDLVVLDEIQLVKQRDKAGSSIRRATLERMLKALPKARVLGMTATPVINDLREGVSLLEAVTGEQQKLSTRRRGAGAVLDAINLHFALLRNGFRYKPKYERSLSVKLDRFVDNDVLSSLRRAGEVLAIERTILPAKLERVRERITGGTLIYLEFVEGLVPIVRRFVESLGLRVGEYIGDTPTKKRDIVKQQFIAGDIDVLIGSRAVALGVDGLQKVCSRLIMLSLPWTHAAFEQVIGRVHRQGSRFAEVEVLIPQVIVDVGGQRWSWDEARYSVIEHKRTLSDTATDGFVPTSEQMSRQEFTNKAMDALRVMIEEVQDDTAVSSLPPKKPSRSVRIPSHAVTAAS